MDTYRPKKQVILFRLLALISIYISYGIIELAPNPSGSWTRMELLSISAIFGMTFGMIAIQSMIWLTTSYDRPLHLLAEKLEF